MCLSVGFGYYAHLIIIKHKQYGEDFQKSEERYRLLTENARDVIYRIRFLPTLKFEYISPAIRHLGYDPEEFYTESSAALNIIHHEDLQVFFNALKSPTLLQSAINLRILHKEGSYIWAETSNLPIYDQEGNYVAIEGIARDITERKKAEELLEHRLVIEKAVSNVASLLASNEKVDFEEFLSILGQAVEADRAYIFYFSDDLKKMDKAYEWCYPGAEPQIEDLQDFDTAQISWWMEKTTNNEVIIIPDVNDMPGEAAIEQAILKSHDVLSLLVVPMFNDGIPLGFIGFDDIHSVRDWSDEDIRLLRVVSEILAAYTQRKRSQERIRYLGLYDQLTDLYNRASFEAELKLLDREEQLPISLVLGDVNGLKLVNDAFGHLIGDNLLVCIAQILKKTCRMDDVIARWGGDEFAIILPKTSLQEATEVCEQIRKYCLESEENPIRPSIALGVATKKKLEENIRKTINFAEDRMYRNKLHESKSTRSTIIASLKKTLGEKTNETEEHALRLKNLSIKMGQALGLSENKLDELAVLAILHDIGKIAISDSILLKPGPLSTEEWEVMKKHPEVGFRIAQASYELAHIAEAILCHHEQWDGNGYPQGLSGHNITLISRIVAIIDTFDAITHERPYKKAASCPEALDEIKRCAGSQFDPKLVGVFIEMMSGPEVMDNSAAVVDI
ncbi:MAG: bifunctional diguanylate cyclase/phosphohydrolase [Bacillota bacterium]